MRITLVVATYNRGEQLIRTVNSINNQSLDRTIWDAIIVNNNSSDNTTLLFDAFKTSHPEAENIQMVFESRQGLSHARNCGVGKSKGEYIAIIDDDEEINPEFLAQYIDFFDSYPDAAAAGGKIKPVYEYETPAWLSRRLERPLAAQIDLGDTTKLFDGGRSPIGGNMAFRREVFDKYGLFDPNLGRKGDKLFGGEEKDLFDRIGSAGGKIYWVPGPTVLHIIPRSRLTRSYLSRLSRMIGVSERVRTRNISRGAYAKRIVKEALKWIATAILAAGYLLKLQPSKGGYLFIMRANITRGLLARTARLS